jgi:hypothetical protein
VPASRRRPAFAALVAPVLLVAACGPVAPTPTATMPTPTVSQSPSQDLLPDAGRPFDAGDILLAMRESRRPGGVPDELETDAIASAVAERIFTFDGGAWPELVAGGSCGPETCTLEVGGTPDGALGEDLYTFSVTPSTGTVRLLSADLRGLPETLLDDLDVTARADLDDPPSDLELLSASWLPPPDDGRFLLAYRSGGEEGSCQLNVTLDARSGSVLEEEALDC